MCIRWHCSAKLDNIKLISVCLWHYFLPLALLKLQSGLNSNSLCVRESSGFHSKERRIYTVLDNGYFEWFEDVGDEMKM